MGKPRLNESTREAKRLRLLCELLATEGHPDHGRMTRNQVATISGVDVSHINKIYNNDRPRGLGADIIRQMRDRLRIDPDFFFDGEEPTKLSVYILSEERMKRAVADHEARLVAVEEALGLARPKPARPAKRGA